MSIYIAPLPALAWFCGRPPPYASFLGFRAVPNNKYEIPAQNPCLRGSWRRCSIAAAASNLVGRPRSPSPCGTRRVQQPRG